jgi:hypothetical protein
VHVLSLVFSRTVAQRQSAMHAAWQSDGLVMLPGTAYGMSGHHMFCIIDMDRAAAAAAPAMQWPTPEPDLPAVQPSAALHGTWRWRQGGCGLKGTAHRSVSRDKKKTKKSWKQIDVGLKFNFFTFPRIQSPDF